MDLFYKDYVSDDDDVISAPIPIPESTSPPPMTLQRKRKQVAETTIPVRKSRRLADRPRPSPRRQHLEKLEVLEEFEVDLDFDLPEGLPDVLPDELPDKLPVVSPTPTSTSVSPLPGQPKRRSTYIGDVNNYY